MIDKAKVTRTEYGLRNHMELDELGNYYSRHVQAMTAEDLHDKSDIAAELASRDAAIDRLKDEVHQVRNDAQEAYNSAYKAFLPIIKAAQYATSFDNKSDGDWTCIVCSGLDGHSEGCLVGVLEQAMSHMTTDTTKVET